MIRGIFRRLAFALFVLYLAIFPGSTLTVALDRVPPWGAWMGAALLIVQGAAVLCWLIGHAGRRGAGAGLLVFLAAWAVEHVGVTTGLPFGRYRYTALLQPQLFGVVPLAILCAWLMVSIGAWQLGQVAGRRSQAAGRSESQKLLITATLVLLLDLQIEPIATGVNQYWIWLDHGPYYGVPAANFAAWWAIGAAMALVIGRALPPTQNGPLFLAPRPLSLVRCKGQRTNDKGLFAFFVFGFMPFIPAYLYLLSTLMFATINLARGYTLAGLIGVVVVLGAGLAARSAAINKRSLPTVEIAERAE
jgi:putative membrane protein